MQCYSRDTVVFIAISKLARPDYTQWPWIMSERSDFSSTPQQSKRDYSQKQICFCACISRPFSKVRVRTISHPVEFILVIATSEWNSKQRICAHKCRQHVRGSPLNPCSVLPNRRKHFPSATEGSQGIPDKFPVLYIQKRCLLDHYEAICQTGSLQQTDT